MVSPIEHWPLAHTALGEVIVSTPHFTSTAAALLHSDLMLVIGELAGETLAALFDLRVVQLPIESTPVESSLIWHERTHRDPAQRWFREAIVRSLAPVAQRFPPRPAGASPARSRR
jgi:DNA-binding transcriptional LysR family regulator